jgi:uncharacterized protein (DUF1778 family)
MDTTPKRPTPNRTTVQMNIRLQPSERDALHRAAAERDTTVAELLRNGLRLQGIEGLVR